MRAKSNVRQRNDQVLVRLLPSEREQLTALAERENATPQEVVRRLILTAATA